MLYGGKYYEKQIMMCNNKLICFLKLHGIYDSFVKQYAYDDQVNCYLLDMRNNLNAIRYALIFTQTKEGMQFWINISNLWQEIILNWEKE